MRFETNRTAFALGLSVIFFSLILDLFPNMVLGANPVESEKTPTVQADNTQALIEAVQKRDEAINNLLQRVETLEQEVRTLRASVPPKAAQPSEAPAGRSASLKPTETAAEQKTSAPAKPASPPAPDEKEEEERLARATLERVLVSRSAVLLPRWTMEIEPSLTYAHASFDRVIIDGVVIINPIVGIAIGDIISERVRRDTLFPTLTFRMGLPWESQAEARFPLRYETERVLRADFAETTRETFGVSDLELAVSKQLLHEKGMFPDLVGSLRWRAPTAESEPGSVTTGFHGLQLGVSGVKVRDPLAFFGGLSYTANIPDTRFGLDINPGDTLGFNMGLALSINPETSINFMWDHRYTYTATAEGSKVPGSALTVGTFRTGFTYALSKNLFLDLGVGIGLTQDAPDVQATIAIPYRIPNLFFEN